MSMKTYLKTNCSFTRNCLLSGLRFATAPLLTCLAALFISVTTPAVASGLSVNDDAPRSTFVTSAPHSPRQVQYMVIELGGRRANDISESGQIVGNKGFVPGISHAAYWPSSQSAPIDLGTLPGLGSVAEALTLGARSWDTRLTTISLLSSPCFGQALTVHPSNSPVCRPAF